MNWSSGATLAIQDTKKTVLRRKVMLNIIIESYSWYDRIFRYSHMTLALIAPTISFLDQTINGSVERTSTSVLVLSSIVAGMIKLKDYLKFDKLKDQAKQQTVKYHQLYQRIERELRKTDTTNSNEDDFISWITRELAIIEVDDPDIPQNLKEKYIKLCKERNIPYDDDLDALGELFGRSGAQGPANAPEADHTTDPEANHTAIPISNLVDGIRLDGTQLDGTTRKQRSPSEEADRTNYREQIKTLDTSKDLDWAIDRLNSLPE